MNLDKGSYRVSLIGIMRIPLALEYTALNAFYGVIFDRGQMMSSRSIASSTRI